MIPDPREPYGRIVNEARIAFAAEQEDDRGARWFIRPWEERAPGQRELDMRIGSAVAVRAVADAGLENERMRVQLFALGAHMAAIREALELAVTVTDTDDGARARRYKAALEALGAGETQERSEAKGAGPS